MTPYLIDLSRIVGGPGESFDISDEVALDALVRGDDTITFAEPARIELSIENVGDHSYVARGQVRAQLVMICGRCLKAFTEEIASPIDVMFRRGESPAGEEAFPVEGTKIDLAPALAEALLLDVPIAPVCEEGCPGLCVVCGRDKREGCGCEVETGDPRLSELGKLLKKDE
jgi:uncharacterized protein